MTRLPLTSMRSRRPNQDKGRIKVCVSLAFSLPLRPKAPAVSAPCPLLAVRDRCILAYQNRGAGSSEWTFQRSWAPLHPANRSGVVSPPRLQCDSKMLQQCLSLLTCEERCQSSRQICAWPTRKSTVMVMWAWLSGNQSKETWVNWVRTAVASATSSKIYLQGSLPNCRRKECWLRRIGKRWCCLPHQRGTNWAIN